MIADDDLLALPDGTQIKVIGNKRNGLEWVNLWISLPETYNSKVKGICGVHDGAEPTFANNGIVSDAHHVYADGNRVTEEANVLNCENGVSLPVLSDDVLPPHTCPADEVTGDEVVEGTSDDTDPLVEGTTIPKEYTDEEMQVALQACQAAADDEMTRHESCNVPEADLASYVGACQQDALVVGYEAATVTCLQDIQAACKPRSNCHLRRY